jgi:glyoxylase-like metal-dependent hydrolase (beta-lactamase superfamily II)
MSAAARLWAGWRRGVRPTPAFRLAVRDRDAARASLERILGWDFERIVPGHGEILQAGGREELAAGYAWLRPL